MIEVSNLYVKYAWRREHVLRGVSLRFTDKHIVLGPNGSGKTTLFRAIAGLVPISSGRILIDGLDVRDIYGVKGLLAINLSEVLSPLGVNAYDNLRLYMDLTDGDIDLALSILEELGIDKQILVKRKPWELSAGQRKAYGTAIALASKAKHVLLDEPFEQLDPARKTRLIKYLREYKGIIAINTHETWVIPVLREWSTYFIFEGRTYGPIQTSKLLMANLVVGRRDDALLTFEAGGKVYSIVEAEVGEPLTKLLTLDKVYELAV